MKFQPIVPLSDTSSSGDACAFPRQLQAAHTPGIYPLPAKLNFRNISLYGSVGGMITLVVIREPL